MSEPQETTITEDALKAAVKDAVRDLLGVRGLVKNGESWGTFLLRQITLERIGLVILVLFQVGGGWQQAKHELAVATDRAIALTAQIEAVGNKVDGVANKVNATTEGLAIVQYDMQRRQALETDRDDRINQSITRAEFNTVVNQQLLPRLDRIERQVWETRQK